LIRYSAPLTLAGFTTFAVVAGIACGSSNPPQQSPPQLATGAPPPGYYQPQPGYTGAPPPGYTGAPPPGYTPPPNTVAPPPTYVPPQPGTAPPPPFPFPTATGTGAPPPGPASAGGGSAQPLDPSLAQAAVIPLQALAAQEAPGMSPAGAILAGNFQPTQTLEQQFTLTAGKCYTILGVGAGITELDLAIIAMAPIPIPGVSPVLQQDSGSGSNATLGGASKGGCWHWQYPFNLPAKWVIKASAGAGLAAGQLYQK
jgi:hypothetical protein